MTTNETTSMTLIAAAATSIVGIAAYFRQSQQMKQQQKDYERFRKEDRAQARHLLHNTQEYKRRKAAFLKRKQEFESSLTEVVTFNDNDEMVVKRIQINEGQALPKGCLAVSDGSAAVYRVTKDMLQSDKFVNNLEQINAQRIKERPINVQHTQQVEEIVMDLNPKKLNKPKDAVFMDFMALYGRAALMTQQDKH